jgi:hypothetical protein
VLRVAGRGLGFVANGYLASDELQTVERSRKRNHWSFGFSTNAQVTALQPNHVGDVEAGGSNPPVPTHGVEADAVPARGSHDVAYACLW